MIRKKARDKPEAFAIIADLLHAGYLVHSRETNAGRWVITAT